MRTKSLRHKYRDTLLDRAARFVVGASVSSRVRAALAAVGYTRALHAELWLRVHQLCSAPREPAASLSGAALTREQRAAVKARLRNLLEEWSEIALAVIRWRSELIRMGILKRNPGKRSRKACPSRRRPELEMA